MTAREVMTQVGPEAINSDTPAGDPGTGYWQMAEIVHNLVGDCHLLILDESTATLTAHGVDMLFEQVE